MQESYGGWGSSTHGRESSVVKLRSELDAPIMENFASTKAPQ
jgi:hypothetical protein